MILDTGPTLKGLLCLAKLSAGWAFSQPSLCCNQSWTLTPPLYLWRDIRKSGTAITEPAGLCATPLPHRQSVLRVNGTSTPHPHLCQWSCGKCSWCLDHVTLLIAGKFIYQYEQASCSGFVQHVQQLLLILNYTRFYIINIDTKTTRIWAES